MYLISLFVIIALLFYFVIYSFPLIHIVGNSMYPTYKKDEFIIACRIFRRKKLKVGDVLIFSPPLDMGKVELLIKRINKIEYNEKGKITHIYFVGDNIDNSYDSRHFGSVPVELILGKVLNQRPKEELV